LVSSPAVETYKLAAETTVEVISNVAKPANNIALEDLEERVKVFKGNSLSRRKSPNFTGIN
jgi:hypothetical protein